MTKVEKTRTSNIEHRLWTLDIRECLLAPFLSRLLN